MSADTTTVRVSSNTKRQLDEIANEMGVSLTAAMDTVVREYRRRMWLEAVAAGYQSMRDSPADWAAEVENRALWDKTIADGLGGDD